MSNKKILLVDVDSTIPNLALMKLSAFHRSQGDIVGFNVSEPDIVYASVVFKKNKHLVDGLKMFYPDAKIEIGGSGYDLIRWLPPNIEGGCPDYSLYPDIVYSMGFTSRGCIRDCYFCIVPEKEGIYQRHQHPSEFVRHDKVKLLDNNWYADPEWFFETSDWLIDNEVAVDVTQGMDIRLLTPDIAEQLKRLKWWSTIHFSYDSEDYTKDVLDGINVLKSVGIDTKNDCSFYSLLP